MPLSIFLFFPISILFLLFPYCFSNFIPPPCFLMPAWTVWQSTCDLCCIHHYIFHLLPVFIYIKVFSLCFHYLIFDHALVLFTSFPPWASIHTLLVQTSYAYLFVTLNHMSITNNLGFGTHSSFGMTLRLWTFALSNSHTIIINRTFNRINIDTQGETVVTLSNAM